MTRHLSATLAGLAGALKALVLGFATLSDVLQGISGEVILMTLVGGWVTVILGAVFAVCVPVFRRGIVGELAARLTPLHAPVRIQHDKRVGISDPKPPMQ